MRPRKILLDELSQLAVVIECHSGITYENRVGGEQAHIATIEGALLPIDVSDDGYKRVISLDYNQWGPAGITAEMAETIDAVLRENGDLSFLSVDRGRIGDCWEGWIYVDIRDLGPEAPYRGGLNAYYEYLGPIGGFGAAKGVLTWS